MAAKKRKTSVANLPYDSDGQAVAWYRADNPGPALARRVKKLIEDDEPRLKRLEDLNRLYGAGRLMGLRPWEEPEVLAPTVSAQQDALRLNVCAAVPDTVTAKVGNMRPRPTFLTQGGNFTIKMRAKKLQRFMDGAYHQSDTYTMSPDAFRDSMIFGTCIMHPHARGRRMANERAPVWEFTVDARDALYGEPRELFRTRWLSAEVVRDTWGEAALLKAKGDPSATRSGQEEQDPGACTYIRVSEAWYLPDADYVYDEKLAAASEYPDGCGYHVLCVGEHAVVDEAWHYSEFPFVFHRWKKAPQGFWGMSALSDIVGIQVEINKVIQDIQKATHLVGQPWVMVRESAILKPGAIVNGIGQTYTVAEHVGSLQDAVQVNTFQPVSPQVVAYLWQLYDKAFEISGASQLSASATAPAGMESARGLERLSDEQSERFKTVARQWEYALGEATARQFIRVAKELDKKLKASGGFSLNAPGDRRRPADRIKWSDVCIDEDNYVIQVFPTSVLPTQPSARIAEVERLRDVGDIDGQEARRLLDLPDLDSSNDLATADREMLDYQLECMLERGEPHSPDPYQNLANAVKFGTQAILKAYVDGVPQEHTDLVRDFVTAAETLIQRQQAPAPQNAPAEAPGGAVPGAPMGAPPPPA